MRRFVVIVVSSVLMIGLATPIASAGTSDKKSKKKKQPTPSAQDPLYSLTLMRQGSVLLQQGQYEEALKRFYEAEEIAPGNATVYNMIGLSYLRLSQLDNALSAFNTALDLIPSFSDARNNRGVTYLALQQYRLAEVDFVAVLSDSTYPHRWQVLYNLGMTYLQRGQLGAAEENFRRAITAPRPVFDAFLRLSQIALSQGNDAEAVNMLEEARMAYPERTEATLRLGELLLELGRIDEARPYLEEVIDKEPTSERAETAEQLLRVH
jgi:Tfp pilus assembly protein PilF